MITAMKRIDYSDVVIIEKGVFHKIAVIVKIVISRNRCNHESERRRNGNGERNISFHSELP